MSSPRFQNIDETNIGDHTRLLESDRVIFLREYTAQKGFSFSDTNSLISNLKKKKGDGGFHYKSRAIDQCAVEIFNGLHPDWLRAACLVPIPPSKCKTDEAFDDRILRICNAIAAKAPFPIDVREMITQVRTNILGVLPLIQAHFESISPDFVQAVDRRYYPIGRGIMVPFEPPLVYGLGGQLYFPWFSFWRRNPLALKRLSLFITLVDEVLLDDPDLAGADFHVLDFSAPGDRSERELRIISSHDIPRVSEDEKLAMLTTFADGYFLAQSHLSGSPSDKHGGREQPQPDPTQGDMFDPGGE